MHEDRLSDETLEAIRVEVGRRWPDRKPMRGPVPADSQDEIAFWQISEDLNAAVAGEGNPTRDSPLLAQDVLRALIGNGAWGWIVMQQHEVIGDDGEEVQAACINVVDGCKYLTELPDEMMMHLERLAEAKLINAKTLEDIAKSRTVPISWVESVSETAGMPSSLRWFDICDAYGCERDLPRPLNEPHPDVLEARRLAKKEAKEAEQNRNVSGAADITLGLGEVK